MVSPQRRVGDRKPQTPAAGRGRMRKEICLLNWMTRESYLIMTKIPPKGEIYFKRNRYIFCGVLRVEI